MAERQHGNEGETLQKTGSIELIIGPMFAGKTSALLQKIGEYEASLPSALYPDLLISFQPLLIVIILNTRRAAVHL